ncbi:MAG TPA: ABC transporter substrate-binding protein [Tepidisphaeraceae bacterium]|nr:ABC transporter substrate-binding protein [Tepidisphaeraceae bacterium]
MLRKFLAAAAAALLICAGCDKKTGNTGPTRVVLQLNWKPEPEFGGFYAAQLNGNFAKHGLDVEITPGGASAPTIEMVGAGTVPFAIVNGDEIVRARSKGNLATALFAVYQTNPQGIMTQAARGFRTIEDIFTHPGTLAMERGLPYSDFLQQKYGFDKVKIVPSPFGNLSLYRVDRNYSMQCFVTSEPLAAKKMGVEPQTFLIAEAGYNPYTTVLATSDNYLKSNPAIVKEMIQAVREGWQEYLANPDKTNSVMGKLNQTMDAETFKASADAQKGLILNESTDGSDLGMMSVSRWQTLIQQLADLKSIDKLVPAQECFTNGK